MPTIPSPAALLAAALLVAAASPFARPDDALPLAEADAPFPFAEADATFPEANATAGRSSGPVAMPLDFTRIVARTSAAVVAVSTRQVAVPEMPRALTQDLARGLPDALAERLRERQGGLRPRERRALGSGFFVRDDGHIVTNNHVIERATAIDVVLDDGSSHRARVVGVDPVTDLAVLKIEPPRRDGLVVASWGDSDALLPGAWTLAVGSPYGFGGTVTVGVLSARQRDIRVGPFDDFLQTDAAINVGNSGGPLFNDRGEVVGVNTAIFSPTGASVGIGFAVPSNTAERVVRALIETGEVRRGFIGASLQDMDAALARAFGHERPWGALVGDLEPDGPAAAAGLRRGDVVLRLDGGNVRTARELSAGIAAAAAGRVVRLGYLRGGERREAAVTVAKQVSPRHVGPAAPPDLPGEARLGLAMRPLPEAVSRKLGLEDGGVIVQSVRPGGLGATGGLRQGDLILQAGQAPVARPADVAAAWTAARDADRPLLLLLRRGGAALFVAIEG